MSVRWYNKKIVDAFEKPKNIGSLDAKDPNVGTGLVGAVACGDLIKLQIKVGKDNKIEDSVVKIFGCASAVASSIFATDILKGKSLDEAVKISNNEIATRLSLPPVKMHCSMLAEDAIKAVVKNLEAKRQQQKSTSENK